MKAEALICWALTPQGAKLARKLAAALGAEVRVPARLAQSGEQGFERLADALAGEWRVARGHIVIAAAGVVVRCLAPLLLHKSSDPAVVVCDQNGRFVISLLSGHLGGANALAHEVALHTGGQAVITTATDCAGLPAFDVLAAEADCSFADLREVKAISATLLSGGLVVVRDPLRILNAEALAACAQCLLTESDAPGAGGEVIVSLAPQEPKCNRLRLHPRRVYAGVGCRRGVSGSVIEQAVRDALDEASITPLALAALASADLKADEPGLREAALSLGVALRCFSTDALSAVPVPHPSAKAAEALGVEHVGVCEAAALLSAGSEARLISPKRIYGTELSETGAGLVTVALSIEGCGPLREQPR